ncbi:hypothetical protein K458DRAFT_390007 [Lentithecium fluviatile CBS 122367]|uniref:Uncharacterized protein n=1 Tax=Lentithecium fluviatile CBS 122367 TaxID=1168545 RepID=A0A6G1IZ32_9PLEO|nr:hypothetical protein K458DRAFT_390007 [Lentithecium fluviatile CBS 122367]
MESVHEGKEKGKSNGSSRKGKKVLENVGQGDAGRANWASDETSLSSALAADSEATGDTNGMSSFGVSIADSTASGVEVENISEPSDNENAEWTDSEEHHSDMESSADDYAENTSPATQVSEAETRVKTADEIIRRGQQARLHGIRDVHWDLYSHEFNQMCKNAGMTHVYQPPDLLFQTEESYLDQLGKKQRRFSAGVVVGNVKIRTDEMEILKYPSSEPVTVFAEMEDAAAAFETKFTFWGVGCLKVALPLGLVEYALCMGNKMDKETEIEFIGVQARQNEMDDTW